MKKAYLLLFVSILLILYNIYYWNQSPQRALGLDYFNRWSATFVSNKVELDKHIHKNFQVGSASIDTVSRLEQKGFNCRASTRNNKIIRCYFIYWSAPLLRCGYIIGLVTDQSQISTITTNISCDGI